MNALLHDFLGKLLNPRLIVGPVHPIPLALSIPYPLVLSGNIIPYFMMSLLHEFPTP